MHTHWLLPCSHMIIVSSSSLTVFLRWRFSLAAILKTLQQRRPRKGAMSVEVTWFGTWRVLCTDVFHFLSDKDLQTLLQITRVLSPSLKGTVSYSLPFRIYGVEVSSFMLVGLLAFNGKSIFLGNLMPAILKYTNKFLVKCLTLTF